MTQIRSAAIVGAGMAGLACARALAGAGVEVTLLDRGRRPGGRLATCEAREGGFAFDHGAQYVTARTGAFRGLLERMAIAGDAAPWRQAGTEETRWAGTPGMQAMADHLARGLLAEGMRVLAGRHVGFLHAAEGGWQVRHHEAGTPGAGAARAEGGRLEGVFDAVVLALPAPQAATLLAPLEHRFSREVAAVPIAPCWSAMLGFDAPAAGPDILQPADGVLAWIARDTSRPGRAKIPDCWVLHATPGWSRAHLEAEPEAVAADLLAAFRAATGIAAEPAYRAAHRWRYALTEAPLDQSSLWDGQRRLGVCGDWCVGARVEAAWISGTHLAELLLASSSPLLSVTSDV